MAKKTEMAKKTLADAAADALGRSAWTSSAAATAAAHPITLYQRKAIPVKHQVQKIATSPASIPRNAAVPLTRRNQKASANTPNSDP